MQWIIKKIVGTKNQRDLKKLQPYVDEINAKEEEYQSLTEEQLKAKTPEFRTRLANGETLDDIMVEAFAVVKNACRRLKGQVFEVCGNPLEWVEIPYDVQLLGGIGLHRGMIAEMATGEGKTLVATCPVYLNALSGKGVHLVTVNDYLARRDAEWMGTLYKYLGLTVGVIQSNTKGSETRRELYNCDITYGTNSEFGFDYLRDNMAPDAESMVQRGHAYALIDEIDSILIDEARTPLIISGPSDHSAEGIYRDYKSAVERLVRKQKTFTDKLIDKAKKLYDEDDMEGAMTTFYQVSQAMPKHPKFMKMQEDTGILRIVEEANIKMLGDTWKHKARELRQELYFTIDEKHNDANLTEKGCEAMNPDDPEAYVLPDMTTFMAELDGDSSITDEERTKRIAAMQAEYSVKSQTIHAIDQLIRAFTMYQKDIEYIVEDNKVVIIDQGTGRKMEGRRWSDGLHQAVEAKEGTQIEKETQTYATITIQNYFRMYDKLGGMTGTAETEADEFAEIYKLDVLVVPTNRPVRRVDYNDMVYRTQREKYDAVVEEISECYKRGQPVLVGTISVEASEMLSKMLTRHNIIHNVLNAKNHEREAEIVARAGQRGAITIATNMAGRGTDIKLGEGVMQLPEGVRESYLGLEDKLETGGTFLDLMLEKPQGLHVIGTERNDSRRVDRQLRGRCARQGDPGSSRFYVSLEDKLMRNFGSDKYAGIMEKLGYKEGDVLESKLLNKTIERAQRKMEQYHFSTRKRTLEYDDVMNKQREVIYGQRGEILRSEDTSTTLLEFVEEGIYQQAEMFGAAGDRATEDEVEEARNGFLEWFREQFPAPLSEEELAQAKGDPQEVGRIAFEKVKAAYEKKQSYEPSRENLERLERWVMVSSIDSNWQEYLREADALRQGIHLMSQAQRDPLVEFKHRAYEMFQELMDRIQTDVIGKMFRYSTSEQAMHSFMSSSAQFEYNDPGNDPAALPVATGAGRVEGAEEAMKAALAPVRREHPKVGRNDPCPCGSGRKYKKCHGA